MTTGGGEGGEERNRGRGRGCKVPGRFQLSGPHISSSTNGGDELLAAKCAEWWVRVQIR